MRDALSTIIIIVFLFHTNHVLSQNNTDSLKAEHLYSKGDSLIKLHQYKNSIEYLENASTIFLKNQIWSRYTRSQYRIAWMNLYHFDNYKNASSILNNLMTTVKDRKQLTNSIILLGRTYNRLGHHDKAKKILKKEVASLRVTSDDDKLLLSNLYNPLSIAYWYSGEYDSTIFYQQKNLSILKTLIQPDQFKLGTAYSNLGLSYWQNGNLYLAKDYTLEGMNFLYQSDSTHVNIASGYSNIGSIYTSLDDYHQSIFYFKKALDFYEKNKNPNSQTAKSNDIYAKIFNNLGGSFYYIKEYDSALYYEDKALALKVKLYGKNHSLVASTNSILGSIYEKKKMYPIALFHFMEALRIGKNNLTANHPELTAYYNLLSDHFMNNKDYSKALLYADTAITINYQVHMNNIDAINLSNIKSKKEFLQSLINKAYILKKTNRIENAISLYSEIVNYYDSLAFASSEFKEKHFFRESSRSVSNNLMELYLTDDESKDTSRKIFNLSEKNKSTLLRLSIKEKQLKNSFSSEGVIQNEKKLNNDLTNYQSQLLNEAEKEGRNNQLISEIKSKIFTTKRNLDKSIVDLEKRHPKYYNLKHNTSTASLDEVQNKILSQNQTLIEYFIGDSAIYAILIDKDSYQMKTLVKNDSLTDIISSLPNYLKNEDFENYSQKAHQLYQQLIAPLELENKNLIIVPDGILWHLNFDVLLGELPEGNDFRTLDYLIRKHNISYAYSATLLLQDSNPRRKDKPQNECLAFSYASSSDTISGDYLAMRSFRNADKKTLPGTQKEVKAIAGILQGDYYFGSFASERNFKENAKDYNILHLALHGETDDIDPMNSRLIFSQNKDSTEDNYLYAFELYNIELNADLAVLSACNTGDGKIEKGEGIISLGRAFSYAGCKSLLISQWELLDATTPQIMKVFYDNLQNGYSKSESLRKAKLKYLEDSDNPSANPYYWASLIQLGNDEPIYPKSKDWQVVLISFLVFLIITYAVIRRKSLFGVVYL